MELEDFSLLEELLGMRRETWEEESIPIDMTEFFPEGASFFEPYQENPPQSALSCSSLQGINSFSMNHEACSFCPFGEGFPVGGFELSSQMYDADASMAVPCLIQEDCPYSSMMEDENPSLMSEGFFDLGKKCEVEVTQEANLPAFDSDGCLSRKNIRTVKKMNGQPSKNLMAERRRRKRLNDRLSMLRSVVPKISKMDRTSILGDTIDYMKELLDRINTMKEEMQVDEDQMELCNVFKELKSKEIVVRNTPKFDVERRNSDTRLEICCAAKPGLLLSTLTTLEALGLEIQQCVISCFNDFGMQASCSEEMGQSAETSSEEIKKALFRNAGYGGKCM